MEQQRSAARVREEPSDTACPLCGSEEITTSQHRHSFYYGSGESAVELTVNVPVRRCDACEFEYLDEVAERLRHEAVCEHFGVLSPGEIRHMRVHYRMTRAKFAQVTGLGEASLNRWENGLNIQTQANDRYLRLLARPENMRYLKDLVASESPSGSLLPPVEKRFRVLELTDAKRKEGRSFQLRKAA
jgi:putative zinc finger/helix-turn-helix YgiT family protein